MCQRTWQQKAKSCLSTNAYHVAGARRRPSHGAAHAQPAWRAVSCTGRHHATVPKYIEKEPRLRAPLPKVLIEESPERGHSYSAWPEGTLLKAPQVLITDSAIIAAAKAASLAIQTIAIADKAIDLSTSCQRNFAGRSTSIAKSADVGGRDSLKVSSVKH